MSPIYCYQCPDCGWSIDVKKSIDVRDVGPICGDCLKMTLRMASGVQMKAQVR